MADSVSGLCAQLDSLLLDQPYLGMHHVLSYAQPTNIQIFRAVHPDPHSFSLLDPDSGGKV